VYIIAEAPITRAPCASAASRNWAGLLRIHRHLLVRPDAVIGLKPAAGGRAIVRLAGGEEIEARRGGAPRLRERLGL
jgi:two-component system LytT family response regulator/two-component system response regulator AlgR